MAHFLCHDNYSYFAPALLAAFDCFIVKQQKQDDEKKKGLKKIAAPIKALL